MVVRTLPEFTAWFESLRDSKVKAAVLARLRRAQLGLLGNVQAVGSGVSELRIHIGSGWQLYFTQRGTELIVLLVGGAKKTQAKDIKRAKMLAEALD